MLEAEREGCECAASRVGEGLMEDDEGRRSLAGWQAGRQCGISEGAGGLGQTR